MIFILHDGQNRFTKGDNGEEAAGAQTTEGVYLEKPFQGVAAIVAVIRNHFRRLSAGLTCLTYCKISSCYLKVSALPLSVVPANPGCTQSLEGWGLLSIRQLHRASYCDTSLREHKHLSIFEACLDVQG